MPSPLSEPLQRFVRERLPSLEQIEIVLLLRADHTRSWSAPEVSQNLGTPPESTAMRLFLLASNGVVTFEGGRYRAASDAAAEPLFEELSTAYAQNRPALTALVGGQPADPLRSFADAFKLKK
ncbi:MAG TPA: hypothetical protein VEO54_30010 [Thermoanaerobaculia bacterium]|nr:hypothetical protein [Thermoanaerobaculia bacterium]